MEKIQPTLDFHGPARGTRIGLVLLLAQTIWIAVFSPFLHIQEICLVSSRKIRKA